MKNWEVAGCYTNQLSYKMSARRSSWFRISSAPPGGTTISSQRTTPFLLVRTAISSQRDALSDGTAISSQRDALSDRTAISSQRDALSVHTTNSSSPCSARSSFLTPDCCSSRPMKRQVEDVILLSSAHGVMYSTVPGYMRSTVTTPGPCARSVYTTCNAFICITVLTNIDELDWNDQNMWGYLVNWVEMNYHNLQNNWTELNRIEP